MTTSFEHGWVIAYNSLYHCVLYILTDHGYIQFDSYITVKHEMLFLLKHAEIW